MAAGPYDLGPFQILTAINFPKPVAPPSFVQQPNRFVAGIMSTSGGTWRSYADIGPSDHYINANCFTCGTTQGTTLGNALGAQWKYARAFGEDAIPFSDVESISGTFVGRVSGKIISISTLSDIRYYRTDISPQVANTPLNKLVELGEQILNTIPDPDELVDAHRLGELIAIPSDTDFPQDDIRQVSVKTRLKAISSTENDLSDAAVRFRLESDGMMADNEEVLIEGQDLAPINEDLLFISCAKYAGYIMQFDAIDVYANTDVTNCGGRRLYGVNGIKKRTNYTASWFSSQTWETPPVQNCGGTGPDLFFYVESDTGLIEVRDNLTLELISSTTIATAFGVGGHDNALIVLSNLQAGPTIDVTYRDPLDPGTVLTSATITGNYNAYVVWDPNLEILGILDPVLRLVWRDYTQNGFPILGDQETFWNGINVTGADASLFSRDGFNAATHRRTLGLEKIYPKRRKTTIDFVDSAPFPFDRDTHFQTGLTGRYNPPSLSENRRFTYTIWVTDAHDTVWLREAFWKPNIYRFLTSDPTPGGTFDINGYDTQSVMLIASPITPQVWFDEILLDNTMRQNTGDVSQYYPKFAPCQQTFGGFFPANNTYVYKGDSQDGLDTEGNSITIFPLLSVYNGGSQIRYYIDWCATAPTISGRVDVTASVGWVHGLTADFD